jgi:hypothetical protein
MQRKINYVYLEMILEEGGKYDVVPGPFKGIIKRGEDTYILLQGIGESTTLLSSAFYGILSIEVADDDYKDVTIFTDEKADQLKAIEMLTSLNKELLEGGYGLSNDPEILDTSKYTSIPNHYLSSKPINKDNPAPGTKMSNVGSFAASHTRYVGNGAAYNQTTIKKDPTPSLFSRTKGKKPTKAELLIMVDKLNEIQEGTYKPVIPEALGDEADVTESSSPQGNTYDEDDWYGAGMYT